MLNDDSSTYDELDILADQQEQEHQEHLKAWRQQQVANAQEYLDSHFLQGEFDWLLNAPATKKMWTVSEVATAVAVAPRTILRWCRDGSIEDARNWGGKAGWGLPKTGLLLFFGQRGNVEEISDDDDESEDP
jgi:hypothetical protein